VRLGRLPYEPSVRQFVQRLGRRVANDEAPVEQAMASLGIHQLAARTLGSLSGGEQRRAHVARVLAQETPLLLLDEPTTHLDEVTARQLFKELQRRAEQGTAVLLVTHDLLWVHRFCNRRVRLSNGKLLPVSQRQNQTYTFVESKDDSTHLKTVATKELNG
jgi:ABC-type cobalamin/Fe3+-siderophores transport system ATPase subunit